MKKLTKISLYNSPVSGREVVIERDITKNFLMLTGYNGSGKSRTIAMIFEALCLARDHDEQLNNVGWIAELEFSCGVDVRALKMSLTGATDSAVREKVVDLFGQDISLKAIYQGIDSLVKHKDSYTSIKGQSEDGSAFACAGVSSVEEQESIDFRSSVEVVAFVEDKIYFNYKREVLDNVFDGPQTIDQTIYALFYDFVLRQAENNNARETMLTLLMEYRSKSEVFDVAGARKYIEENFSPDDMVGSPSRFESSPVFVQLNKFFAMTNRKLIWHDKHAAMELSNGTFVPWILFSKGEKTLLALMLIVYLYQHTASFVFDEPDLSLHMEWQKMLLPAFESLAPDSQFIISTHSPFMVMNTASEQVVNMAKYHKDVAHG